MKLSRCLFEGCQRITLAPWRMCESHLKTCKAALATYQDKAALALVGNCTNLYAIKAGDFVKFGVAFDVMSRLSNLQTGCPLEMKLIGYVEAVPWAESAVHSYAQEEHVRGEWFRYAGRAQEISEVIRLKDYRNLRATLGLTLRQMAIEPMGYVELQKGVV